MCAIAGLWNLGSTNAEALEAAGAAMAQALAHRGPDDQGLWTDAERGLVLAQRRLAIIDLSPAGHQPMVSRCGRYVIVFNGECYNFEELRDAVLDKGTVLRGHSDTEVILEGIARLGIEPVIQKMAGMFAIALWDRKTSTLTLIRDRVGKKPLYYGIIDGSLVFASELKALHAIKQSQLSLCHSALGTFLQLGYIPAPATVFKEVLKLPAGHILTITTPKEIPASKPYWTVQRAFESARDSHKEVSEEKALGEFETLISQCVRERMISDVPLGAFLSGGIDSSLVVSLMQAQSTRKVRTFSIAFQEPEFNEGPQARMVAEHLGTDHTELTVTASDALELIPRLSEIYDEPFADASQIPTCLLCQLTRRHVTVSLSGDGGDELFLGYNHYEQAARRIRRMREFPLWTRRMIAGAIYAVPERVLEGVCAATDKIFPERAASQPILRGHQILKYANALSQETSLGMYLAVTEDWFDPGQVLRPNGSNGAVDLEKLAGVASSDSIELFGLCDLALYIPEDILVKVDRASMAWALEARAPLLDHRIVEFAMGLPGRLKRRNGVGKVLMRNLLRKFVPSELTDRPKQGFSVPVSQWLRGPLRDWAEDLLAVQRLSDQQLLDPRIIRRRWEEHLAGRQDWGRLLWSILVLQSWLQRWRKSS